MWFSCFWSYKQIWFRSFLLQVLIHAEKRGNILKQHLNTHHRATEPEAIISVCDCAELGPSPQSRYSRLHSDSTRRRLLWTPTQDPLSALQRRLGSGSKQLSCYNADVMSGKLPEHGSDPGKQSRATSAAGGSSDVSHRYEHFTSQTTVKETLSGLSGAKVFYLQVKMNKYIKKLTEQQEVKRFASSSSSVFSLSKPTVK